MNNSFISSYKKVKNLGASHHGSHHFMIQRLSAILLIPLLIWTICILTCNFHNVLENKSFNAMFASNFMNKIPLLLLFCISIYHGMLGIQVIIEDYIRCKIMRNFLIISCKLFSIMTIFILILTVLI